uniref:Uncharacterized protein n=1 Tax=Lepeophtheirus salmonis TaxID=72036 RepID=A0A0K2UHP6_LEPSM
MCFYLKYQKVCNHGAITFAVDGNLLAGSVFEKIWTNDSTSPQSTSNCCFQWI